MNVTIENSAPCKKLMRVDVEAQKVDETFEEITTAFQREAKLPGFRPGKVPRQIVKNTFARQIEEEVRRRLFSNAYSDAVKQQSLHVVGTPKIEEVQFGKGKEFKFTVELETAPEFELPEYKGLPLLKEARSVSEADIQRALNVLREREAQFNDVDRPAQNGDILVVNYTGSCEGKPLTDFAPTARGLTQQSNFWIEIKPGSFITGFTEQLVGAVKGEKRTLQVDFPEDFVAPQLSGKKGVYEVEVAQVKEKVLPELNEEFAKRWGAESLEALRTGVTADLQRELDMTTHRSLRNQAMQVLSQKVQCELPQSLVAGETRSVIYDIVSENQQRGIPKEEIEQHKDEIFNSAASSAKERLKVAFLMGRIAEKESIKVQDEELAAQVYQMAEQQGTKPEKLIKDVQKTGGLRQIHERILLSKVLDLLVKNAEIREVPPVSTPAS